MTKNIFMNGTKMSRKGKGCVAAGNKITTEAAAEILEDGGNAFDAVLAGLTAAYVAEPSVCSPGGGGFLLASPSDGKAKLFDFFCQTPKYPRSIDELEFKSINVDFGVKFQEFHIGMGSVAVPGIVAGIFAIHKDLCSMPLSRIFEPAIRHARKGVQTAELTSHFLDLLKPIYLWTDGARKLFNSREKQDKCLQAGEILRMSKYADMLEALSREGADLFYKGEIADSIVKCSKEFGGSITHEDLADYQVISRKPLEGSFLNSTFLTNPVPSSGGTLISFSLELLKKSLSEEDKNIKNISWMKKLSTVMELTNRARMETGFVDDCSEEQVAKLLSKELLSEYYSQMHGRAKKIGGTTHISVIDANGSAASMTHSNGEGCGHIVPNTDMMLNNMLGEEDLSPRGFFQWKPDTRLTSMMSPTIVTSEDGIRIALGTGGANRIRSAVLQVMLNVVWFNMSLHDAVNAPRVHKERDVSFDASLDIERGFNEEIINRLSETFPKHTLWTEHSMFFGGVHSVS
ncbi:MAG: gamma-glutamyltransferase, partial [Alphaproteobacteria bacterium]|nr:gamma-glutamyltransferase [Alphaproteobacteria bacterium]